MAEPSESVFTSDVHGHDTLGVNFCAGIAGGCAGVLAGHPLDTVKVRLQSVAQAGPNPEYRGGYHCFTRILAEEGFLGLYKGMASPLVGVAIINSLLFGVYGYSLRAIGNPDSVSTIFWAGAVSGVVNGFFSCPMELIKIRLQNQHGPDFPKRSPTYLFNRPKPPNVIPTKTTNVTAAVVTSAKPIPTTPTKQPSTAKSTTMINATATMTTAEQGVKRPPTTYYKGPIDCIRQIYSARGLRGLFQGLNCTLLRETPSYAAYFATYELLCEKLLDPEADSNEPSPMMLLAGGVAGVMCWIVTYPLDVVKTRLQSVDQERTGKYKGTLDCLRQLVRTEGYGSLTKGLGATCVRAFPTNAATFYAVSWAKKVLTPFFVSQPLPSRDML